MATRPAGVGPAKEQRTGRLVAYMNPRLLRTVAAETDNTPQDDGRRCSGSPSGRLVGR
jgi:hypothetical protein